MIEFRTNPNPILISLSFPTVLLSANLFRPLPFLRMTVLRHPHMGKLRVSGVPGPLPLGQILVAGVIHQPQAKARKEGLL